MGIPRSPRTWDSADKAKAAELYASLPVDDLRWHRRIVTAQENEARNTENEAVLENLAVIFELLTAAITGKEKKDNEN